MTNTSNVKLENFVLGDGFVDAILGSTERTKALSSTLIAMAEVGIDKLPYENLMVTLSAAAWLTVVTDTPVVEAIKRFPRLADKRSYFTIYVRDAVGGKVEGAEVSTQHTMPSGHTEDATRSYAEFLGLNGGSSVSAGSDMTVAATKILGALIVGLNMRGARKERKAEKVSKLAQLGIGKKRPEPRYSYTTTISISYADVQDDGTGTRPGHTKRPHLRRGHVREQHWGPANQFVKKIFVEPIFVNSDGEFVSSLRERYNISSMSAVG